MNERLYLTTGASAVIEPIEELSRVRLTKGVCTDAGDLPPNSIGTVVLVHGAGEAYLVEFDEPIHAVVTLDCNKIEPVTGESRADLAKAVDFKGRSS